MSSIEIVPWICRDEWEFCRDNLFGEDLLMKTKAVEHLHIWKTRCPNLHLAVECTLILMDTHLQGLQQSENENRLLNMMNLELMYSMALTKFVNFVTDSTAGNRSSNTLQNTAQELGIPAWIIDLRHKAAHSSSVPSLPLLREAIDFCLKWLYDNYWGNGDFEDVSNIDENSFNDVESCLNVYSTANKCLLDCEYVSQIGDPERQIIYRYFCKTSEIEDNERFDNWSLNDTCKITLKKLSKIIRKNPRKCELLVDKLLEEDGFISQCTLNNKGELNEAFAKKWSDIISVICCTEACHYLLRNLLTIVADEIEPTYRKKGAAVYFNEILKNVLLWKDLPDENVSDDLSAKSKKKRKFDFVKKKSANKLELRRPQLSDQEASSLLNRAVEHPSHFVTIFLKNLLKIREPSVESSRVDKVLQLINVYGGLAKYDGVLGESDDYSLKTLLGDQYKPETMQVDAPENDFSRTVEISEKLLQAEQPDSDDDIGIVWKKCSSSWKWNETTFGVLPWQEDFKPWLKLYQV